MKWRVTYRGRDGRQRDEAFEAESRTALFKLLESKSIRAMRIAEDRGERKASMPKIPLKVLAGCALVAVAVGGIAYWLTHKPSTVETEAKKPTRPAKIATATPSAPKPTKAGTTNDQTKAKKPAKPEPPPFQKRPGAMQLPDGKVLTFPAPKEGEIRKVYAYGHMYECDHLGNFKDVTPRKLFHTAFEGNFLALAVEGKTFIPAFLTGLDPEEVRKMLTKNYQPIGDETEEEMAQLKAYDEMRCAALQYIEEGGSFDDFVMDFANYEKKSRETNAICLREVMTLCKEGKIQEAKEVAEAATKLMEQKGLRPFKLPPHVKAAFDSM